MGLLDGLKKYIATDNEVVKDPVCGMQIAKETSLKSNFKESTYYFCSQNCKENFNKNPESYVKGS